MTVQDELVELRSFVAKLDSREITLHRSKVDVTQQEADVLRREIAHLETVLARVRHGGPRA
jgi:hypothetical protein